jgi:hypothetical protein
MTPQHLGLRLLLKRKVLCAEHPTSMEAWQVHFLLCVYVCTCVRVYVCLCVSECVSVCVSYVHVCVWIGEASFGGSSGPHSNAYSACDIQATPCGYTWTQPCSTPYPLLA